MFPPKKRDAWNLGSALVGRAVQNQWPESTAPAHFATCTAPRWQVAAPRSMVEYEAFHKWRYPNSWMVFVRENPSMALFQDTFIFTYITLIIWHSPPETTWIPIYCRPPSAGSYLDHNVYSPRLKPWDASKFGTPWNPDLFSCSCSTFLGCFIHVLRHVETNQWQYIYICYI